MRTIKSNFLVLACLFIVCNIQGAGFNERLALVIDDISDDSKMSDILCWAENLANQCEIQDSNKKSSIVSQLKDGQEFFKLEEATAKEINPDDTARSRSLLMLCRAVNEAIAVRDRYLGGRAIYDQNKQEQNVTAIAEGGVAAAIDVCAETLTQNYLPTTLLSFENPATNPRMGFLGTAIGLIGERHTQHLQFFSTIKKLSALHAATTTLYHAYQTMNYLVPRAYILRKHITGRAFSVKVAQQVRQSAKLH